MRQSARQRPEPHIHMTLSARHSASLSVGRILVPSTHRACRLLAGLAPRVYRLASRPLCRATLSARTRTFGSPLAPRSQTAPSGHNAAQYRPGVARARSLGVFPVGGSSAGEHDKGSRCVGGNVRPRTASPQRLYLAAAMMCALPAAVESAQYIRLRTSVLPWLQPGRWGAAPHWVSAAFYHLSTILRVRGRISNPLVLHPTPPLIASERACLKPLHPDCMGCMSSR